MALIPMPPVTVMEEALAALQGYDWQGIIDRDVTCRHFRNRASTVEERDVIAIKFVSDDLRESDWSGSYGAMGEVGMILALQLIIDVNLQSEDSGDDPTGLALLMLIAHHAVQCLKDGIAADGGCADAVADDGRADDDENSSDEGRLVQSISVLYRVAEVDRTVLLRKDMA